MKTLIKNGNIVFPEKGEIFKKNIILDNDKISGFTCEHINSDIAIDAEGLFIFPGFIDMHAHFRDPGQTYKEDIKTGLKAALAGGITTALCMPNTIPDLSHKNTVEDLYNRAKKVNAANLIICASATQDRKGQGIYSYEDIYKYIYAVSDDGNGIQNKKVLEKVLIQCRNLNLPYLSHCEDENFDAHIPESEELMIAREIIMAKLTRAHIHIQHISTGFSLQLIELAKKNNINITCEVCPHHLFLDEDNIKDNGKFKVNPPLRHNTQKDLLLKGLKNGIIDVIASDHAPHSLDEKNIEYSKASFGLSGIETMIKVCFTELLQYGLTPDVIASKFTTNPANILKLKSKGRIETGYDADITILDLKKDNVISKNKLISKGKNIGFEYYKATADVAFTIVGGMVKWQNGSLVV